MRVYHQCRKALYIIKPKRILYTAKGDDMQRQAFDDMPNLTNASVWIKNSLMRIRFRLFLVGTVQECKTFWIL